MRRYSTQLRPLVKRSTVSGLVVVTLLGWCGLLWIASQRQQLAAGLLPSALSLRFLELGLAARPDDDSLRLQLAQKRMEAGQLPEARGLAQRLQAFPASRLRLLIDIDHARWSAVSAADSAQRALRLTELRESLDAASSSSDEGLLLRAATLYRETEQLEKAAAIFDKLARSTRQTAHIARADAAWLEAGQPLAAAELHAFLAAEGGPEYARLALERAQSSGDVQALYTLMKSMRAMYPQDAGLLRLAIRMAEANDVKRACDLALELTRAQPGNSLFHREAARLAEASGRSLCALDQYMWLWRHEHRAEDKLNAMRLARANWDLELVRELLGGAHTARSTRPNKGCGPAERRRAAADWEDRFQVFEALGDKLEERKLLSSIVATPDGDTLYWWRRKLELEKRSDDYAAALNTLAQMVLRFPERSVREELAELQLRTGHARAALATLLATPSPQRDVTLLRRSIELAAAVGNIQAERALYEELTLTPDATLWDYQRLLALVPNNASGAQLAEEAGTRFQSFDMFYVAWQLYERWGDEAAELALLERAAKLEQVAQRADYWQLRINVLHARAARAAKARDYPVARAALENADDLLQVAAKQAPSKDLYDTLWGTQHAQALDVGMASGDKAFALRAFVASEAKLAARERVYLLIKLGQPEKALAEARQELSRDQLRDSDRSALESDALSLIHGRATDMRLLGHGFIMPGLQAFGSTARVDYADLGGGLRATFDYTEYQAAADQSVLSQPVRDLTAAARGRLGRFALELGATVRDADQVRPFGMLQALLSGDEERGVSVQALANVQSLDTARLRVFGVADALAVKAAVGLGQHFWASSRIAGEMYYTRQERHYLGWGSTVDLSVGWSRKLPAKLGNAGVRAFGRGAPRFAKDSSWLPTTSVWTGIAASIARGQLDAPVLFGKQLSYLLDASIGWLLPISSYGWSVTAQLGVSVFGADNLTLAATAGNVLGASGFAGTVGYALSFF